MMNPALQRSLSVAALVASVLVMGCEHLGIGVTAIGDIVKNPTGFEGKEVRLKGTVRDITKIPVIERRSYLLADSTGEITVVAKGELPGKGDKVVVRGRVSSSAVIGGQALGLGVDELERSGSF